MEQILLGAIAGGFSGALGHFTAGKIHDKDKAQKIYPIYSSIIFVILIAATL